VPIHIARTPKALRVGSFFLACSLSVMATTAAHAKDAVMPYTASELPVMATTPNLVYGTYGPQVILDAPTFKNIPDPIYLDKALEERILPRDGMPEPSPIQVDRILIETPAELKAQSPAAPSNQTLTLGEIKDVAKKALAQCQEEGFLCDAAVSYQDTTLHVALTPLNVESVNVNSEDEKQKKAVSYLTRWTPLEQPIRLRAVARELRIIQSNPDLPLSAELEPIPYAHQVRLNISVDKKQPKHLIGSWNNLDQPIFGRQFGAVTAIHNNLTGHGDSLMTSVVQGYRSTGGFSHYEYPITPALHPFVEASFAQISPFQQLYTDGDTHGWATRITTGLKYTLYDRPTRRLSADVDFDFKQAYSYAHGGDKLLEREAVRTIRGGINYDQKWKSASLSMRHEFAGGIPIFSGSYSTDPKLSWFRGGSQYFRYTGYAIFNKQLPLNSTATLNTQWQFTPNGLSNFDVGGLGGTFYGRGYREVYLFEDNYTITSLQWQVPASFLPKKLKLPFSDKALRDTTSFLAFMDYGYGWISSPPKGLDPSEHILSTGVGVRSQLTNRVSGRLDVGFPILREPPFNKNPRIYFGLDVALF
jgi:hemolysin activation/secretion protein